MSSQAAAAEFSILHARARLRRDAKLAYLAGEPEAAGELSRTRDELGRMVMRLLSARQGEVRP